MNFTMWDWIQAMWHNLMPIWVIGIACWTIVIADKIERVHAAKKNMVTGKAGDIIRPQEKSLDGVFPIHKAPGLPKDDAVKKRRTMRNVRKSISAKWRRWAPSWTLHRRTGEQPTV